MVRHDKLVGRQSQEAGEMDSSRTDPVALEERALDGEDARTGVGPPTQIVGAVLRRFNAPLMAEYPVRLLARLSAATSDM